MLALLWMFRKANAVRANRGFRWGQIVSAATMAFGHGTQDAQKTMGVIALTLVVSGHLGAKDGHPAVGDPRRGRGDRGWAPTPAAGGSCARWAGASSRSPRPAGSRRRRWPASCMLGNAQYGLPVSTTHVITSSVMGVGATRRFSAVRWGVAGNIVFAWVLTIPAAAAVAALMWAILHPILV